MIVINNRHYAEHFITIRYSSVQLNFESSFNIDVKVEFVESRKSLLRDFCSTAHVVSLAQFLHLMNDFNSFYDIYINERHFGRDRNISDIIIQGGEIT